MKRRLKKSKSIIDTGFEILSEALFMGMIVTVTFMIIKMIVG